MQLVTRLAPRALSAASAAALRFQPLALATRFSYQHHAAHYVAQPILKFSVSRAFSFTARIANAESGESAQDGQDGEDGQNSQYSQDSQDSLNSRIDVKPSSPQNSTQLGKNDPSPHGVFVRNLVFDATEDHLKEMFEKFGKIMGANIARDPRGLSRGYGFVFFDNEDAVNRATAQVNGSFIHGRRIMCSPRVVSTRRKDIPRATGPTHSLYIGNIPYETSDVELNRLFRDMENLRDVRVAVDRVTGWPRGFAHADFTDVESAEKAHAKLQGATLGQRELRIDFATTRDGPKD